MTGDIATADLADLGAGVLSLLQALLVPVRALPVLEPRLLVMVLVMVLALALIPVLVLVMGTSPTRLACWYHLGENYEPVSTAQTVPSTTVTPATPVATTTGAEGSDPTTQV